jgi:hypothetical protein
VISPREALLTGAEILGRVLVPNGFEFHLQGEEKGSGGMAAWGEFVRNDRRLELHFRYSLGLVRYHVRRWNASHETYMRELGVWSQCRYPGVSEKPVDRFHDLAHDLKFADDFLTGGAASLKRASAMDAIHVDSRKARDMARYVGDVRKRDDLRDSFQEKRYGDVIKLAKELKYPKLMTQSELKMIEIARKRAKTV